MTFLGSQAISLNSYVYTLFLSCDIQMRSDTQEKKSDQCMHSDGDDWKGVQRGRGDALITQRSNNNTKITRKSGVEKRKCYYCDKIGYLK